MINSILNTDSYKASHWLQDPDGTENKFSYIESRGGKYKRTLFFGLQYFIKEYLTKPITKEMIIEAEIFWLLHGEPFNRKGWEYILEKYNGFLPIRIKAVKEGALVPTSNILVSVEATDKKCAWLVSYVETALLRAVWYPTTVATNSWECKQVIKKYLDDTADDTAGQIMFKLHDFGARGTSSYESAGIGGMSHLVNFMGSDTVTGVLFANRYYNITMAGFSIPAAEHSTITVYGKEGEADAYRKMLKLFAKPGALVAIVSDSYNIYHAAEKIWGEQLKQEVIDSGAVVIIRPDSGNPVYVVRDVVRILSEKFGYTINKKGFKVLNNVRIIQGDGINRETIIDILEILKVHNFSAENVAFGMGGALLQQIDRDTQKFAMKCSAIQVDGIWLDVFKQPITDPGKNSKKGRLMLFHDGNGSFVTDLESNPMGREEALVTVFENGVLMKEYTFEEVRATANSF
jgi:nicotinamide phosphoribosyltransferase